ncbi:MAG: hypothetical protein A2142_02015 [candidate division Zixibacteria bacterium RBG_16_48_11]|nr:MAG: hypothetical protein A2142_02015 [candidate division Zixibacteria bacterium RBG_16_48_11]
MNPKSIDWGLLFLRLGLGVVFLAHGSQKLFSFGLAGVSGFLSSQGYPLAGLFAAILILTEFGGGILVLLGLLTRLATFLIMLVMAVAIFTVHLSHGFFLPQGMEQAFALFFMALALVLCGGGRFSLDTMFFGKKQSTTT